jgi:hypothetical protein
MLTVACVFKSGGEYTPEHVRALQRGFAQHLTIPYRFVCLSDVPGQGYDVIPLTQNWPGWWSKLELFRPNVFAGDQLDLFAPVFFADLDTCIVGNCDDIVLGHRFTVLENFWSDQRIGSGLMAWDTDLSHIFHAFKQSPSQFIREYTTTERWGDQGFIRYNTPTEPERFQHKFVGRVVSYKFHVKDKGVPPGASIVCFHGKPRPWQTALWQGDR